ncbi:MAG: thioredoxin family protein [Microthrixaceae bacterium]
MVAVNSTMLPLGTEAPQFELRDGAGRACSLSEIAEGSPVLVAFVCNHCPYVRHIGPTFGRVAEELRSMGVEVVAINSNDVEHYPEDAPDKMVTTAEQWGWSFPYLFDEDQAVAKAYRAACTPDLFLFDGGHRLAYRGQFDSSRPRNDEPIDGSDLLAAARAVVAGEPVPEPQVPSIGCNIKWREGNEPEWFG